MDKMKHRTLLVIDDSQVLRNQVVEFLKEADLFEQHFEADNGLEGFKILLNNKVDVVLCDLEMPGIDGLKFLAMRNARKELSDIPVILLTGHEAPEKKIKGLEQGASDYVTKPFDAGELIARVKVQLKLKVLQDDLKEQNQQLELLSNTDSLTQLANRRFMMNSLDKEYNRSRRNDSCLSLIMADIDHFKSINDTYGHQEGDRVLEVVATVMSGLLREYDLAARFGGEEFALILPETDLKSAFTVASRVREKVESNTFDDALEELRVTISLGVATCPHGKINNINDLIRLADDALYEAKRQGRNRVVVADID